MTKLTPYVRYNDAKCREAFTFYQRILGGTLTFSTIGETPMAKEMPADKQNLVMHAQLIHDGIKLYGSDMMRDVAKVGDNFSLSLDLADEKEAHRLFDALSKDGDIFMPLEKTFWGAFFGMVTDKYGIEWMINCELKK